AYFEGFLFWTNDVIVGTLMAKDSKDELDYVKLAILFDETPRINEQGKIEFGTSSFPKFINYCAFILRTAAECWNFDPAPLFADSGWNELQKSVSVRNRITHPKSRSDLDITDSEIKSLEKSHRWLTSSAKSIFSGRLTHIGGRPLEQVGCPPLTVDR